MKKTMVFENETAYDNWFDVNEEKEGGHDFIEDRVVIVKGTRTIQNRKFNGFSADATINCKNVKTAIGRFIKELKSNGFNVSEDEFESNVNCFTDCGYVVEIEEIDEDRFYINYMCYQYEAEEATETETTEPETDEFNLTPEQTAKLISDYDDFMRQMESLKEKEEPEATEEPTAEKQITSEELGTDDTTEETKTENVDWGYFDKFDEISGIYLPPTGEGETKATQLVTAISKLVYKWYNDGDVYDNTAYMEGWCNDLSSYANWIYANYLESQPILDRIYKVYDDVGYEHILKDLADKFLNKEFLSEENKKISYGSIYNADGNFRFDDYETENDDDYEW